MENILLFYNPLLASNWVDSLKNWLGVVYTNRFVREKTLIRNEIRKMHGEIIFELKKLKKKNLLQIIFSANKNVNKC